VLFFPQGKVLEGDMTTLISADSHVAVSHLPGDDRKLRVDGAATRTRLLDAVVQCILEHGRETGDPQRPL
jgi:hypothetical protein